MKSLLSNVALLLANAFTLYGVFYLGWNLQTVILLYWMESGIIGFFTLLKILYSKNAASSMQFITAIFFCFHFGIFMMVHLSFLLIIFGLDGVKLDTLKWGVLCLFLSHGLSYLVNFIVNRDYKKLTSGLAMIGAYKRIFVMQFTIILSSTVVLGGSREFGLVLLIVLKITADLWSFNNQTVKLALIGAKTKHEL